MKFALSGIFGESKIVFVKDQVYQGSQASRGSANKKLMFTWFFFFNAMVINFCTVPLCESLVQLYNVHSSNGLETISNLRVLLISELFLQSFKKATKIFILFVYNLIQFTVIESNIIQLVLRKSHFINIEIQYGTLYFIVVYDKIENC